MCVDDVASQLTVLYVHVSVGVCMCPDPFRKNRERVLARDYTCVCTLVAMTSLIIYCTGPAASKFQDQNIEQQQKLILSES